MKIAVGIPFYATSHDAALRLCLLSLERYAGFEYDIFLLVDDSDPASAAFDLERLVRRHPRLRARRYRRDEGGHGKQVLVDWVTGLDGYDAAFFLHADVFLWREGLLPGMLRALADGGNLACAWTVPLFTARRRMARAELRARSVLVAPRLSTWLFCLDCARYRELAKRFSFSVGLFRGHHAFLLANAGHPFVQWVREQPEFAAIGGGHKWVFCEIGSYFRYALEKLRLPWHSMGVVGHPDFSSRELRRHPAGFAHVEQFTPKRFRADYTPELFAERERLVLDVLAEEYGVTGERSC